MSTVEQLHGVISDPNATQAQKDEAAKLLLEASGEGVPQGAPTPDFEDFCLWHTWKYGKNRGAGDFGKWKDAEGVKLTRLHDDKLLKRIAAQRAKEGDPVVGDLYLNYLQSQLSWNYFVGPQWRNRDISFLKLDQ